jgi:hypothetical protein
MVNGPSESSELTQPNEQLAAPRYPIGRAMGVGAVCLAVVMEIFVCMVAANWIHMRIFTGIGMVVPFLILSAIGLALGGVLGAAGGSIVWVLVSACADAFQLVPRKGR